MLENHVIALVNMNVIVTWNGRHRLHGHECMQLHPAQNSNSNINLIVQLIIDQLIPHEIETLNHPAS